MRFDDRLLTVLNQPVADRHDVAVRWRQLVDLVARAGSNAAHPTVGQAVEAIRAEAPKVDESVRAATARAVSALPLPLALLEYFASDNLAVSAPVLAAATLDQAQWRVIMSAADDETRRFIETIQPEIGAHAPPHLTDSLINSAPTQTMVEEPLDLTDIAARMIESEAHDERALAATEEAPASEPTAQPPAPSLHEVVERIERRRRSRLPGSGSAAGAPRSHAVARSFRWECGPGGEIAWVDGAPRGALIGRSIARAQNDDRLDPAMAKAFASRGPFRDALLTISGDGALAGEWTMSGMPAFDPASGRFAGYRGIAAREEAEGRASDDSTGLPSDPDSLRELVHEIKTPLNAIIGFAEIIEGQYLGPADDKYRQRAQEIVHQSHFLLTAIDDLDFTAKVRSSQEGRQRGSSLAELVERMLPELRELAIAREVTIEEPRRLRDLSAAIEPELAERLIHRLCSLMIEEAGPGEKLRLSVERDGERARISLTRPASLANLPPEQLLGTDGDAGPAFPLQLLLRFARLAGAELLAPEGSICLLFPRR